MSGNQTLSSFAKIMQSFILMQNLQNLYWIEGGDIFGALFFFKKVFFLANIGCCHNVLDKALDLIFKFSS